MSIKCVVEVLEARLLKNIPIGTSVKYIEVNHPHTSSLRMNTLVMFLVIVIKFFNESFLTNTVVGMGK